MDRSAHDVWVTSKAQGDFPLSCKLGSNPIDRHRFQIVSLFHSRKVLSKLLITRSIRYILALVSDLLYPRPNSVV